MYMGLIGFFLALIDCSVIEDDPNWWWLLWGFLIGMFSEIVIRLGIGQPVAEIFNFLSQLPDLGGGGDFPDLG